MASKVSATNTDHVRAPRIHKKNDILEISDEKITTLAIEIVKSAEERILNELQAEEQARLLRSLQVHSEEGLEV